MSRSNKDPTMDPTKAPTASPTKLPTFSPSNSPSYFPTLIPTSKPTTPTFSPTLPIPTEEPTAEPSPDPTQQPTRLPTSSVETYVDCTHHSCTLVIEVHNDFLNLGDVQLWYSGDAVEIDTESATLSSTVITGDIMRTANLCIDGDLSA